MARYSPFGKLQREADARNGDEKALAALADGITDAVRWYKKRPSVTNYLLIEEAVKSLRRVEMRREHD